jgi:transcriptional regulator with XRE-family HTH domain
MRKTKLMKLKGFRASKGFTQDQMAEKWGMSTVQYQRRENGIIPVKSREIAEFSEKFGISRDEAADMLIPAPSTVNA